MLNDPIDSALVEAINQIGHIMGIQTIAEFVENNDIQEAVRKLGVDYAQGYGVARPAPLDDILMPVGTRCSSG
jgi:EAL domain-containing protein (putative c-di-GMP-specific phosphodiesterase class I)